LVFWVPGGGVDVVAYGYALVSVSNSTILYCLHGVLIWPLLLLPSLVWWTLPLGMALAPVVVREHEQGTWDTLRTTPLDTETILLNKARARLLRWSTQMYFSRGVLVFVSLIVGLISLNLFLTPGSPVSSLPFAQACGVSAVVSAAAAGLFLLDRAQQFVLMAVAALAASVSSRAMRIAQPGAITAAFLVWLADAGIGAALIATDPQGPSASATDLARWLAMLGPLSGYMAYLSPERGIPYIALTLALRELAVRLIWRWIVRGSPL
jgi:hypothetical protein